MSKGNALAVLIGLVPYVVLIIGSITNHSNGWIWALGLYMIMNLSWSSAHHERRIAELERVQNLNEKWRGIL